MASRLVAAHRRIGLLLGDEKAGAIGAGENREGVQGVGAHGPVAIFPERGFQPLGRFGPAEPAQRRRGIGANFVLGIAVQRFFQCREGGGVAEKSEGRDGGRAELRR